MEGHVHDFGQAAADFRDIPLERGGNHLTALVQHHGRKENSDANSGFASRGAEHFLDAAAQKLRDGSWRQILHAVFHVGKHFTRKVGEEDVQHAAYVADGNEAIIFYSKTQ